MMKTEKTFFSPAFYKIPQTIPLSLFSPHICLNDDSHLVAVGCASCIRAFCIKTSWECGACFIYAANE